MKRFILSVLLSLMIISSSYAGDSIRQIFIAHSLIGSGVSALDSESNIPFALIDEGDTAFVVTENYTYFYYFDLSSTASESSPDVINPDGNTGDGRWLRIAIYDPLSLKIAGTDNIKNTHIDWGTGATQIYAGSIPILDSTSQFTATNIEDAIDELHDLIEGLGGGHDSVTLGADAEVLLSLISQQIVFDTQSINNVFAGPASGGAGDPTFRLLVVDDIPDLSSIYSTTDDQTASEMLITDTYDYTDQTTAEGAFNEIYSNQEVPDDTQASSYLFGTSYDVTLTWKAPKGNRATDTNIYRAEYPGSFGIVPLATVDVAVTEYNDTTGSTDTWYQYKTTATDGTDESANSNFVLVYVDSEIDENLLPDLSGTYEPADSAIAKTDEAETLSANWVNTVNPWADNEIASSATWNTKTVSFYLIEGSTDVTVVDKVANYSFTVPVTLNGWNITDVGASVEVAGITGTMTYELENLTSTAQVLSTVGSIATTALNSTSEVIDTAEDDVATNDLLVFNVTAIHSGTVAKGFKPYIIFTKP